ncbi:MAG TPA: 2Fe-2S iron-sulfur cluster-binding protein [Polyangiaceae bacterium]|nr:2Fe-2S iron-sulfur cluster-binding protein [Polyangiaceae bacterium]
MTATIRVLGDPPVAVPALTGETLLASLLEAGVAFPHNCQSGNCGACKCELIEGDTLELPYSEFALSAEERSRGLILACRTQIWGDCSVRRLEAEDTVLHPSRVLRCRLSRVTDLTHDIKALELVIVAGGPYTFSAGQHAQLKFGPGVPTRNYSMANRPDQSALEFFVRHVPRGQASGHVFTSLHLGAEITVSGPLGNAYLRESHRGPILAVAGGSGLAPIKSIVETALHTDPLREVHLYFGVRDERDIYLEPWLNDLRARHQNVVTQVVLSQPSGPSARRKGLVATAVMEDFASFEGFKAYLAGPPLMVEALQLALVEQGVPLRDVHADAFYSQAEDAFNQT